MHTDRWLDVLFGMGDDTHPYWLMAVRTNILIFAVCGIAVVLWNLGPARRRAVAKTQLLVVLGLTALAIFWRFGVAGTNLLDFAGIPYSRLLLGYKGHFATAQFYSLLYRWTARDIEHAISFNRIAGVLTIPLVYYLCRHIARRASPLPAIAAFLFAVSPLHILFSASDVLSVFSLFLTAASYVLIVGVAAERQPGWLVSVRYVGGFAGLALLTQVRYENALFLAPVALFLSVERRRIDLRAAMPGASLLLALLVGYAYSAAAAGLSFQNPVRLVDGVAMVVESVLLNPFVGVPALLVGAVAAGVYRGALVGLLGMLVWLCALGLPVLAESGHGASRVYSSWLILILPLAACGFAAMLDSGKLVARALATAALLYLGAQPLLAMDRLTARHLEVLEHEFFVEQLSKLPEGIDRIVVPDDELLRRRTHSTIEVFNKYSMTLAGKPEVARHVGLVRLTDYLENTTATECKTGQCAFFFGLPCLQQAVYPFTNEQCEQLVRGHRLSVVAELEVVAAPFLPCAIYTGTLRERLCDPATKAQRMFLYRIGK